MTKEEIIAQINFIEGVKNGLMWSLQKLQDEEKKKTEKPLEPEILKEG